MKQELLDTATLLANWIWQLLNSSFSTALAGAFAGACGAYWIIERIQKKHRLIKQVQSTNAAIMVAGGITNSFCGLKHQMVKDIKDTFDRQRVVHEDFMSGKFKERMFEFQADFRFIYPIPIPIDTLQKLLFEEVAITGRPLIMIAVLSQTIDSLRVSIEKRNELIVQCKESSPALSHEELASLYFGYPDKDGNVDRRYADCVDSISNQTDDCIFFSKLICEDLYEHGQKVAKLFGRNAPSVNKFDFAKAEQEGLIPNAASYSDWMNMIKAPPQNH